MRNESAVDFPGNYRLHLALSVRDVEASKRFYELLLGSKPSKERLNYAKFEPIDPSVNLTLNETDAEVAIEGGAAHFGVQVKSVAEVHAAIERFKSSEHQDHHGRSDNLLLCRSRQSLGGGPGWTQVGSLRCSRSRRKR